MQDVSPTWARQHLLVEGNTAQTFYPCRGTRDWQNTVSRNISQLRRNERRQYEPKHKVYADSSTAEPLEQVIMKHVSSRGLEHQDQLRTVFQGAQAEQLHQAGTKAASPLDITATHSTAPGIAFDSCTEDEHAQQAVSSESPLCRHQMKRIPCPGRDLMFGWKLF